MESSRSSRESFSTGKLEDVKDNLYTVGFRYKTSPRRKKEFIRFTLFNFDSKTFI